MPPMVALVRGTHTEDEVLTLRTATNAPGLHPLAVEWGRQVCEGSRPRWCRTSTGIVRTQPLGLQGPGGSRIRSALPPLLAPEAQLAFSEGAAAESLSGRRAQDGLGVLGHSRELRAPLRGMQLSGDV